MDSHASSHPPRKKRKWLRRLGITFATLIALVVLAYAFENWRGRRAWDAYVKQARAAGEPLDRGAMVPSPVPDEQNFAMVPLLKPLFEYDVEGDGFLGNVVWRDPKHKESLDRLNELGSAALSLKIGNWRRGTRTDMQALAATFAKDADDAGETAAAEDSAAAVLKALKPAEQMMAQIAEAANLPHSRFPIHHEEGLDSQRPHMTPMLSFGKIARLRASARLAAGDVDGAYQDVLLGFRLSEKMEGDPVLIGYLVRTSLEELAMSPLWEGLADHRWNEEQLAGLQQQLAKINHASAFQGAMRAERQYAFRSSDEIRTDPPKYGKRIAAAKELAPELGDYPGAFVLSIIPQGWYDTNKAEVGRLYGKISALADPSLQRFDPRSYEALEDEIYEPRRLLQDYGTTMARKTAGVALTVVKRAAAAQSTVDLALIAVTLERHRLRHGSYPRELATVDSELIEKTRGIPDDPLSGHSARYQPTEDGTFVLYFDSWNQKDDGGVTEFNYPKGPKPKIEKGDWVWPWPEAE